MIKQWAKRTWEEVYNLNAMIKLTMDPKCNKKWRARAVIDRINKSMTRRAGVSASSK